MLRLLFAGTLSLACVTVTHAFDGPQWASIDAEMRQWFKSLRNSHGESCCDSADGVRIEDPDWKENGDHSYEVFARGKWNQIPPDRVLQGSNRVGYPILWWPPYRETPTCFLPGSKG